jgi:hypothetical protein
VIGCRLYVRRPDSLRSYGIFDLTRDVSGEGDVRLKFDVIRHTLWAMRHPILFLRLKTDTKVVVLERTEGSRGRQGGYFQLITY